MINRNLYIGASESPALFGESSFVTAWELWHYKRGLATPKDVQALEYGEAGNLFEPVIAGWVEKRTGWKLQKAEWSKSADVPGMACTPDFNVLDSAGKPVAHIEIKNTNGFNSPYLVNGAPSASLIIQLQHQMRVTGLRMGYAVICVGGQKLEIFPVPYHERFAAVLVKAIENFWFSKEPPEFVETDRALETIKAMNTEIFPGTKIDLSGSNHLPVLIEQWETLKGHEKKLAETLRPIERERKAIEQEIFAILGKNEVAKVGDLHIVTGTVNKGEFTVAPTSYRTLKIER